MVRDRRAVERRLGELGQVLAELRTQEEGRPDVDALEADLSRRWRLERGLLVAADLIVDVASHVTAAHFTVHPPTYEKTVSELAARDVIREETYETLRGIGGFRNVLAHEYLDVDLDEVVRWRGRMLDGAATFIADVERWLDEIEEEEQS